MRGNCQQASKDFLMFLEEQGIMYAEIIPIGILKLNTKKYGWFHADKIDPNIESFTASDIADMKKQKLSITQQNDRVKYIQDNNLEDEFKWIPHSWVELRDKILDPSGFYLDGKSGQFDNMVYDKSHLTDRYHYFK